MPRQIRTKMTNKQAALSMWSWIMLQIVHNHNTHSTVSGKKKSWLKRHKDTVDTWVSECLLCERHPLCKGCPLGRCISCTQVTAYSKVVQYYDRHRNGMDGADPKQLKARALEGCRQILNAIEQEEECQDTQE